MVHRKLVQEHLSPLVGMGYLHAGDESDGHAMRVRNHQMMGGVVKESFHRVFLQRVVEQLRPSMTVLVAGSMGLRSENVWARRPG